MRSMKLYHLLGEILKSQQPYVNGQPPGGDLYPCCSAEDFLVTFWRTISLDASENEVPSIKVSGDKEEYFW